MEVEDMQKKPANPREKCNFLSSLTFSWTASIFKRAQKTDIELSDLCEPLDEHASGKLGDKFVKLWNEELKSENPKLHNVILYGFKWEIILYAFITLIRECAVRVAQPIFLSFFISFFKPGQTSITRPDLYIVALGLVLCIVINLLLQHPCAMGVSHLGLKYRVGLCSLIYRKALRLSIGTSNQATVGKAVNLLSNDVRRFDMGTVLLNYIFVSPIQLIIMTSLMWQYVSWGFLGVFILVALVPIQYWISKKLAALRSKTASLTDKRISLINEVLSGIQVIKMYAWEKRFVKIVNLSRRNEIKKITKSSYFKCINLSFYLFNSRFPLFCTLLVYALLGNHVAADEVFVIVCFYEILKTTMAFWFPLAIAQIMELKVTFERLEKFMLQNENDGKTSSPFPLYNYAKAAYLPTEEVDDKDAKEKEPLIEMKDIKSEVGSDVDDEPYRIHVYKAFAKWDTNSSEFTLKNVTFKVRTKRLVAIIGPVGSGKSSLIYSILKELPLSDGFVSVGGEISYSPQEPWIFGGSIRQNILFGSLFDRERYSDVVEKCALHHDFTLLPHGDQTILVEGADSISGGQRARINLARAAYRSADIYLLDDPLSAVDVHVGRQLFDDCIINFMTDKTRILVTHQLQYLHKVDHIVMMKNGCIEAEGTYHVLKETNSEFSTLISKCNDGNGGDALIKNSEISKKKEQFSTNKKNKQEDSKEKIEEGSVGLRTYKAYAVATGSGILLLALLTLAVASQILASGSDYLISYWVNNEEIIYSQNNNNYTYNNSPQRMSDLSPNFTNHNHILSSLQLNGSRIDSFNETNGLFDFNNLTMNKILKDLDEAMINRRHYIYAYSGVIMLLILITMSRSLLYYSLAMRASLTLHKDMFLSVIHATMSFFNTNSTGQILNRFSQDIGSIDDILPMVTLDVLQNLMQLIGIVIIITVIRWLLFIPMVVLGVVFYYLLIYYLPTSRRVKRLEAITRSPVFSHLTASLKGMVTIRAFKAQRTVIQKFDSLQDLYTTASFYFMGISRAFAFWLDSMCVAFIILIIGSFLGVDIPGGDVGLAITQVIGLTTMFQWGVRQATCMENEMISVERILQYNKIEQETEIEAGDGRHLSASWPQHGQVKFDRVSLRYLPSGDPVLRDVSFEIKPREKVGVVGRTGAGKSSIINALVRLAQVRGTMEIDGVDTEGVCLEMLRSKISIIPQKPILFTGTVKENLDPFSKYDDADLWRTLDQVELKTNIESLPEKLNYIIKDGGSSFSVGQKQLLCLARAIIQKNRIIVLDEATANVDSETDNLIQETIRNNFSHCTIITIAHRLNSIMDSDKVLVMDDGKIVEFDHPSVLLQNKDGLFRRMIDQSRNGEADTSKNTQSS